MDFWYMPYAELGKGKNKNKIMSHKTAGVFRVFFLYSLCDGILGQFKI